MVVGCGCMAALMLMLARGAGCGLWRFPSFTCIMRPAIVMYTRVGAYRRKARPLSSSAPILSRYRASRHVPSKNSFLETVCPTHRVSRGQLKGGLVYSRATWHADSWTCTYLPMVRMSTFAAKSSALKYGRKIQE